MTYLKHLAHPLIALALQLAIWIVIGNWWAGVFAATIAYFMRESTQAEYRWIERFGAGLRTNMPWWGRFDPRVWSLKDWADWLGPMAVTILTAWILTR